MKTELSVALDWSPNTNHTLFYLLNMKSSSSFKLNLLDPAKDHYKTTPARLVQEKKADIAIGPSESVLSYSDSETPMMAIAAILQHDTSAILCTPSIKRPKDLDHTTYGSYQARLEDHIIKKLIKCDQGIGEIECVYPPKLEIFERFLKGEFQSTWIFEAWEGLEVAKDKNYNLFRLKDYDIPYGYTPLMFTRRDYYQEHKDMITTLLAELNEVAHELMASPDLVCKALMKHIREDHLRNENFLIESQKLINQELLHQKTQTWGVMDKKKWSDFVNWLRESQIFDYQQELDLLFHS